MKSILFSIAFVLIAAILLSSFTFCHNKTNNTSVKKSNGQGIVLIELFTSQGCSSCPPADDLLGSYAEKNDAHIIPIAFHVDYWNRLGWKDSFSTSSFSQRQEYYDEQFLHATVYTPQLIVNGTKEMVGSNKAKVKAAIDDALNETPSNSITLKNNTIVNGQLQLAYTIEGAVKNTVLNVVIIQNKTTTRVKAGENDGSTLVNYNVVRTFVSTDAKDSGTSMLTLPDNIDTKNLSIVLFTQSSITGKITGAIKQAL
jgi:hypothetical protein